MMCRLATSILIAACLGASAAGAVETPRPGSADPRIKTIDYDPQQVVRIVGVFRTATQIRFAAEESILHVALGDTSAWEVAAETNILFAKPTVGRSPTNLIVTTRTANGETRHYTFELTTRSGPTARNAPDTFFVVQFRYPQAERAKVQAALSAEAQVLEQRVLQLKLERAVLAGPRNLAYALQGSAAIAPSEVTDNGRFTVLRFPGAQPVPAVYVFAKAARCCASSTSPSSPPAAPPGRRPQRPTSTAPQRGSLPNERSANLSRPIRPAARPNHLADRRTADGRTRQGRGVRGPSRRGGRGGARDVERRAVPAREQAPRNARSPGG